MVVRTSFSLSQPAGIDTEERRRLIGRLVISLACLFQIFLAIFVCSVCCCQYRSDQLPL
jgi:hypothetical protein